MRIPAKELSDAKSLCTVTELRLIESSHGPTLEKADQTRLKKKIALAREQRDKWRDLFTRQRRDVQQEQASRDNQSNKRSERKSELFANALTRFEAQLAKVMEAPPVAPAAKATSRPVTPKADRVRAQRVARATTKLKLKELELPTATKKVSPPTVDKPVDPVVVTPTPPTKATTKTKSKSPTKKATKKVSAKKVAGSPSRLAKAKPAASKVAQTKGAAAAAKSTRIKVSGKDSRVRGHVSASGKRSQARRDSKR